MILAKKNKKPLKHKIIKRKTVTQKAKINHISKQTNQK